MSKVEKKQKKNARHKPAIITVHLHGSDKDKF